MERNEVIKLMYQQASKLVGKLSAASKYKDPDDLYFDVITIMLTLRALEHELVASKTPPKDANISSYT